MIPLQNYLKMTSIPRVPGIRQRWWLLPHVLGRRRVQPLPRTCLQVCEIGGWSTFANDVLPADQGFAEFWECRELLGRQEKEMLWRSLVMGPVTISVF